MKPEVYWIDAPPGRLAIMPRPRSGDWLPDEIRAWRAVGIGIVLSLLTNEETAELGLADEQTLCRTAGVEFRRYPIEDRGR